MENDKLTEDLLDLENEDTDIFVDNLEANSTDDEISEDSTKDDYVDMDIEEQDSDEVPEKSTKPKKWYQKWYFKVAAVVIGITLIFNHFFTIVFISGNSMEPSFHDKNVLLGHRQYDLWRFDVVTISSKEAGCILIKRVIGLPGETIEYKDNMLFVNGEYQPCVYSMGKTEDFSITLGRDEYYCLGDNRENSYDSRKYGPFTEDEIFSKLEYKVYPKKN